MFTWSAAPMIHSIAAGQPHNSGSGAKYTRSRLPVELVYHEEYDDRHEALSREWHIKRMRREEKMKLIEGTNT